MDKWIGSAPINEIGDADASEDWNGETKNEKKIRVEVQELVQEAAKNPTSEVKGKL